MALTNAQYEAIMRIYDERRTDALRAQEARIREAYARVPRLEEIASEIASRSIAVARAKAMQEPAPDISAELDDLAEERRALLLSAGFPEDHLDLVHICPICGDTGYIGDVKCKCFRQLELDYLYSGSRENMLPDDETFVDFSLDYYRDEMDPVSGLTYRQLAEDALDEAKQFVRDFKTTYSNLCFYGDTGVGKTYLTNCIARELIEDGASVVYLTAYDLFGILARSAFERDDQADAQADQIFLSDLLVIDDLGTEMNNTFVSSQLFVCINERILRKKPTILSTNLSLEQLREGYSERTYSRIISNYRMIRLCGEDIRIRKQLTGGK